MAHNSSRLAFRPMLSFRTSGRYQTWSLRWKQSFAASFTIRGKVNRPTHHQEATKRRVANRVKVDGSTPLPMEATLAMIFKCDFEEYRLIRVLNRPPSGSSFQGSWTEIEYDPFRELKGETWKSLVHSALKFDFTVSSTMTLFLMKYIRRSSKVLLVSTSMAASLFCWLYKYQKDAGLKEYPSIVGAVIRYANGNSSGSSFWIPSQRSSPKI